MLNKNDRLMPYSFLVKRSWICAIPHLQVFLQIKAKMCADGTASSANRYVRWGVEFILLHR